MGHTILLADDSVTIRRIVELAFRDTDIRVDAVGSGHEAIERFEAVRPELVLADVVMPPPTGYDLCRTVKTAAPGVPVLLLRGSFEPYDEQRARAAGADGHVSKPFEADRLVARVRDLLRSASPQAPAEIAAGDRPDDISAPAGAPAAAPTDEVEEAMDDLDAPSGGADGVEAVPVTDGTRPIPVEVRDEVAAVRVVLASEVPGAPEGEGAVPASRTAPPPADRETIDDRWVEAVARRVVEKLSDRVVREIAWDVVPDLATAMIRERLREIEGDDTDRS